MCSEYGLSIAPFGEAPGGRLVPPGVWVGGYSSRSGWSSCSVGPTSSPVLAARSFLKAGGGYSRLAAPAAMIPFLAVQGSEMVFLPQRETSSGSIALANKPALLELSERVDMVVMGPGLSLQEAISTAVLPRSSAFPMIH